MSRDAYVHHVEPGKEGAPALFLFHGTGGDETQLLGLAHDLLPCAAVIAPRGDVSEHGAARFFRRTAEGVYDMDDLERATAKMTGFVRAHVQGAAPVLGLGYSNGANILASVLFAEPDLFDAAVLMHPLIPFRPQTGGSLERKRVLVTAGRRDPICPPELTRRLEAHLRAMGADVALHWHEGGHNIHPREVEAAKSFLESYRREAVRP